MFASLADELADMAPEDLQALVADTLVRVWTRDLQVVGVDHRPVDLVFYDENAAHT